MSIIRRRGLLKEASASDWDIEWDYTMGLPDANGWTARLGDSSRIQITLDTDGLKLETRYTNGNRYVQYRGSTNATGVIEAKILVKRRTSNDSGFAQLCFSNGTNGIYVLMTCQSGASGRITLWDNSTPADQTQIGSFSSNVWKIIRIELENGYGRVYINGTLAADNIDASTCLNSNYTLFGVQQFSEFTNHFGKFEYVKVKLGRI